MPKQPTFPKLYDELKTLSVSFLKKHGYLKPNQLQSGTVTWSTGGNVTGTIAIIVSMQPGAEHLALDYSCNGKPVNYRVRLTPVPSNLGIGLLWYFVCPNTGKRCRKLYLADTYFLHRDAFSGCMYRKQAMSKYTRLLDRSIGIAFSTDELYNQLRRKHLKKQYAGKPTKRYLKLADKIKRAENFNLHEQERAFLK